VAEFQHAPHCVGNQESSSIHRELDEISRYLGILHDDIAELQDRLGPVLSIPHPETVEGDKKDREPSCPLAASLRDLIKSAELQHYKLRYILDRLEL
jgi:hypothetical protein